MGGMRERRTCPRCRTNTMHVRDESPGPCGWVCERCMHYTTDPPPDTRPAVVLVGTGLLLLVLIVKAILGALQQ